MAAEEFRSHFFQVLQQNGINCPACQKLCFAFAKLRLVPADTNLVVEHMRAALLERCETKNAGDEGRNIVVTIGGVGYLVSHLSCCWINQFVDEWIK